MSLKNIGSILNTLNGIDDLTTFFVESEDAAKSLVEQLKKIKNPEKLLEGFAEADDLLDYASLTKTVDAVDDVGDAMTTASGGVSGLQLAFSGLVNTVKPFLPMLAKVAAGVGVKKPPSISAWRK